MRATFERGDSSQPRGHALVYFREVLDPDRIRASYLIVAPIQMDLAKYVPPMFAGQLAGMIPSGPTALPLPPMPEPVDSLDWLRRLADARDDDLLAGGTIDPQNPQHMMITTSELAAEYATLWAQRAAQLEQASPPTGEQSSALADVDDILMSIMSDSEKVSRIARLSGTLRYALEAGDEYLARDTRSDIERVGRHLVPAHRLDELLDAAQQPGPTGARLLELYIERSYKLALEDYGEVERVEREIAELRTSSTD